ncbi:nucleotide-diphospho-sugar transferase [Chaetomium tenue]|uniref:Nucleotide-diphospho-sugar transferase n=1 Tax=Chaetomium tenue TaxID=1854479 RepID=A0ACB7PB19_9PEZI|nr:nucleotide-diphospho-sugar transferase [Chaetomium globosum]
METETTGRRVWATVLYDRLCLSGVLVLDFSLRKQGTKHPLIVIMTNEAARDADITSVLDAAGITMVFVDTIFAEYQGKRYFGNWQKLSAWSLTDYERIVLLDSNQLILQPIDNLQTTLFSHGLLASGSGDRNDYIAAVLTAPGHPHPSTIILHPSLAQYHRLRSTLNEFFFSRANEQDVLVMAYRGRVASLLPEYSALESLEGMVRGLRKIMVDRLQVVVLKCREA